MMEKVNFVFVLVECIIGFYGENCNSECGFCLNEFLICYYVMGVCVGGCKFGYILLNCDIGD